MTPMAWSIGSKLSIGETTRTENTTTPKPIFKILQKKWPPVPGLSSRVETAGWKIVRRPGFEVAGTSAQELPRTRTAHASSEHHVLPLAFVTSVCSF